MNESVEQFKRDLLSIKYHREQIDLIDLKIDEISNRMVGVGSAPIGKISPTVSPSERSILDLIDRKDCLLAECREHERIIDSVYQQLSVLPEDEQIMLKEKFIDRIPNASLEKKYNYTSRALNKKYNRIIRKSLGLCKKCSRGSN